MKTPTKEVVIAMNHVKTIYPTVTMVVYNKYGQHQFMDDDFNAPTFDERVDVGLIEDAGDSLLDSFPIVFHF